MAAGGKNFKLLTPKEIASVLNRLGVHPQVTSEAIDKPTPEQAQSYFQELAAFSYDMEPQQMKAHLPSLLQSMGLQHADIYEEAVDAVAVFKLARHLALINLVDDFHFTDIWDPQAKRLRVLLSAIINCCRYKENKFAVTDSMKEDLHALDAERLELVERVNEFERSVQAAQDQHSNELHDMREAEMEVQKCTAEVEKLHRQKTTAERVVEETETGLTAKKDRRTRQEEETERLREQVAELKEQVAESPEGIEQEIAEQKASVREHRASLDDLSNEKRSRTQRDQVLNRLGEQVDSVRELLLRLSASAEASSAVQDRKDGFCQELDLLRQHTEARRSEQADFQEKVRHLSVEQERAKEAHEQQVQALATRRQQAFEQHQQLQAKRNEEQKQQHHLQMQRMELETEVANAQRTYDAELAELRERQAAINRKAEDYAQQVDQLRSECDSGRKAGSASVSRQPSGSPPPKGGASRQLQPLSARLVSCSPSPSRNVSGNPLGFMSPGREF